jgi:phage gp16-like protein
MMHEATGKSSLTQLTDAEAERLLGVFKAKGWQAKPKSGSKSVSGRNARADHPVAKKARAMWISLHQLGAIENGSEQALEAFAARQLKCDRLQWARQDHADGLIEALMGIARRHGWDAKHRDLAVVKVRLMEALLAKLIEAGLADPDWDLADAACAIAGFGTNCPRTPRCWGDAAFTHITQEFAERLKSGGKDRA